jgi:hypothetical protein
MKTPTQILARVTILVIAFFGILPFGATQQVYQNNFQTAFDLDRYEINYTLLQKNADIYFFVPSKGNNFFGNANYYLQIFEVNRNFQPLWAGQIVLEQPFVTLKQICCDFGN